jgi:hypothetical protein
VRGQYSVPLSFCQWATYGSQLQTIVFMI